MIPHNRYNQQTEMQVRTLPLLHQNNDYYHQQQQYFRTLPASYVVAAPEQNCYRFVSDERGVRVFTNDCRNWCINVFFLFSFRQKKIFTT